MASATRRSSDALSRSGRSVTASTSTPRLRSSWAEVTEVVSEHRAFLLHGERHQTLVRRPEQIWPLGDRLHIYSAPAKLLGDLHRELLVEQRLHEASACWPATQAA